MILDADMSQIEWRVAAELSQDEVMISEIENGVDAHAYARDEWMKFPATKENRTIAKIFNFRMIYGGSPYSFYMDPKMPGFSLPKWTKIVNSFYEKYEGLKRQQDKWVAEVYSTGHIVLPSGRQLWPRKKEKNGIWDYSRPTIVNYPVQAYATADLMPLAMGIANKRLMEIGAYKAGNLFINQVHDSMIFDTVNEKWALWMGHVCVHTFRQLPRIIELIGWQKHFRTPLTGDVCIGPSWGGVEEYPIDPALMARLDAKFPVNGIWLL